MRRPDKFEGHGHDQTLGAVHVSQRIVTAQASTEKGLQRRVASSGGPGPIRGQILAPAPVRRRCILHCRKVGELSWSQGRGSCTRRLITLRREAKSSAVIRWGKCPSCLKIIICPENWSAKLQLSLATITTDVVAFRRPTPLPPDDCISPVVEFTPLGRSQTRQGCAGLP